MSEFARLSLNQKTVDRWTMRETLEGCARAEIPFVGLWREKVAGLGLRETVRLLRELDLQVSSLCRGGFFPTSSQTAFEANLDDNFRAIEAAAKLGTKVLVLVCGAAPDHDLNKAREMIAKAIAKLAPFAAQHKVKLGIEPLHPIFAADRSAIVTLEQANDIAEQHPPEQVGVVIDAYHVWWDPKLEAQIARAAKQIVGFHIDDWIVPIPDPLLGRGMMGDGVIDLRNMRRAVDAAGYTGPIEVEIFNRAIWDSPGDQILERIKQRYLEHVLEPSLEPVKQEYPV
jgi:sugar phosphate isomerase/epimerase